MCWIWKHRHTWLPQGQVCDVLSGRNSNACVAGPGASAWAAVTSVVISCCFESGNSAGWCCLSQFFATWMGCQSAEPDASITQLANDLSTMNMSQPG